MFPLFFLLFPLVAGLLTLALGRAARRGTKDVADADVAGKVAFGAALVYLMGAGCAWVDFLAAVPDLSLFEWDAAWIDDWGARFHLRLDAVSLVLVLLVALAGPLIVGSALATPQGTAGEPGSARRPPVFHALILATQSALAGAFLAQDALLFYVCWELALVPVWFLFLWSQDPDRGKIALRFLIYTLFGSVFMLAALIFVHAQTRLSGAPSLDVAAMQVAGAALDAETQRWVFAALFLAFAIKMPLVPFHGWQPSAYFASTAQGRMLLSGLLLKLGVFGLLRWLVPLAPLGLEWWSDVVLGLCVTSVIYGSLLAIAQRNLTRMISYASLAHAGLIAAGILAAGVVHHGVLLGTTGLLGGTLQMLSHGVIMIGLFCIADIIERRSGSTDFAGEGALRERAPYFGWVTLLVLLASIALPLTAGFWGEFLLLLSLFEYEPALAAAAGFAVVLGAVYVLRAYQRLMLGEVPPEAKPFIGLSPGERWLLGAVAALVVVIGVAPGIVLEPFQ